MSDEDDSAEALGMERISVESKVRQDKLMVEE